MVGYIGHAARRLSLIAWNSCILRHCFRFLFSGLLFFCWFMLSAIGTQHIVLERRLRSSCRLFNGLLPRIVVRLGLGITLIVVVKDFAQTGILGTEL